MTGAVSEDEGGQEYKQVEYGPRRVEIPVDWEFVRLGDQEYSHWITQGPNPDYSKGTPRDEYRALKTKDLYDDGIKYESADRISPETFENRKEYELENDDTLVAIVGRGSIGKSHIFENKEGSRYIFTRAIGVVRPNSENLLPEYLHQYFQSHDSKEHFLQSITGSTGQEVLRTSTIKAMGVPLPSLSEQRRIVAVLSTIDEEIQQTEEIVERTEELRVGLSQQFFREGYLNHETEERGTFGQMPVDWDLKSLDEVADVSMGSSPKSEYYNDSGEGLPFFQANNEFGYRNPKHDRWCSEPKKTAEEGDTLVTIRGTYVGQVNEATEKCCIGRGLAAVSAINVDQEYLFHQLDRREAYVKSIASGSTFDSINSTELRSLQIQVPPPEEQEKIAEILKQLQMKYLHEVEYKEKLQELKRGLMQDLLTGKVRTPPDLLDQEDH